MLVLANAEAAAQSASAADILARVDANEIYSSISYEGEMVIEYRGKRFVKKFTAKARGSADSFIEFTNGEDRGTKYLKTGGRLYVYSPDTEQVMPISGHLLKESMMGSDLSYEDTIENDKLSKRYVPTLSGSEILNGREAWVLDLAAIKKTESYPAQKLWVAKDNADLLRFPKKSERAVSRWKARCAISCEKAAAPSSRWTASSSMPSFPTPLSA